MLAKNTNSNSQNIGILNYNRYQKWLDAYDTLLNRFLDSLTWEQKEKDSHDIFLSDLTRWVDDHKNDPADSGD